MAWSVPHDFVPGEMFTHTMGNAIRDQLKETGPAKASSAGWLQASAAGALSLLAFSGNGNKVLRANSSGNAAEFGGYSFRQAPISNSATVSPLGTSAADIVTATITTTGGVICVLGSIESYEDKGTFSGSVQWQHTYTLRRDSSDLLTIAYDLRPTLQNFTWAASCPFFWLDTSGAGTYVFRLRCHYTANSTDSTGQAPFAAAYIWVFEV